MGVYRSFKSRIRDNLEPPINRQDIYVKLNDGISKLGQLQIALPNPRRVNEFSKLKFRRLEERFEGSIREFFV